MRFFYLSAIFVCVACTARIPPKPRCGDGLPHTGETCDDGNNIDGDGCDALCQTEDPICGNGIVEIPEECDDGNTNDLDGCSSLCVIEPPNCGNGALETNLGEECDDGPNNANAADACRTNCLLPACGDALVDSAEQCDDGNNIDADGCEADCSLPACDNGIIDPGELCFGDAITLSVANRPRGIDIGDLNLDGRPDIVISEQGLGNGAGAFNDGIDDSVAVLLQQNDGSFGAPVALLVADQSRFIRAVDVDGDNTLEVFVSHQGADSFTQLINQDGVLSLGPSRTVADPVEFAIGDIDGDNSPDFVIASLNSTLNVTLSSVDGSFAIPTNDSVEGVDLGDVNNDGVLDLLAVCGNESTVPNQVMLFSGADVLADLGATLPINEFSVGLSRSGRLGDIDGDGLLDIVVVDQSNEEVVVFFQQNNGNFLERRATTGAEPIFVATVDLDNDGDDDIISADEIGEQATIISHEGGATFSTFSLPVGARPRIVATGDINQDTLPDFATSNLEDSTITVYLSAP
jgi:cysteine-rich repeat protein